MFTSLGVIQLGFHGRTFWIGWHGEPQALSVASGFKFHLKNFFSCQLSVVEAQDDQFGIWRVNLAAVIFWFVFSMPSGVKIKQVSCTRFLCQTSEKNRMHGSEVRKALNSLRFIFSMSLQLCIICLWRWTLVGIWRPWVTTSWSNSIEEETLHGLHDIFWHQIRNRRWQEAVKALVDHLWYGKACVWQWGSGSATVALSMVVILASTLRTGPVGSWHGTLALALVKEAVALGKGFQGIFFFFGWGRLAQAASSG